MQLRPTIFTQQQSSIHSIAIAQSEISKQDEEGGGGEISSNDETLLQQQQGAGSAGWKMQPYANNSKTVATITDTQFTPVTIPLIMHFHAVLGPSWPIVFFTTQQVIDEHLTSKDNNNSNDPTSTNDTNTKRDNNHSDLSGSWRRAVREGSIEIRTLPDHFDMKSRKGVNLYLSDKWLWEQLAPAQHVLLFQTDAIVCANSGYVLEDFLQYDFIGAFMSTNAEMLYNGGLSLRNRSMLLDILNSENNGVEVIQDGEGEDGYFSRKVGERGGNLPAREVAGTFALQYRRNFDKKARPLGYHKIHKNVPDYMPDIAKWCPEIALTKRGTLGR